MDNMSIRQGVTVIAGNAAAVDTSGFVKTTTNQTIAGTKTFSTSPIVGTATQGDNSTHAASTAYVDTAVGNAETAIMAKFQVVTALPGTIDENTFYFIKA